VPDIETINDEGALFGFIFLVKFNDWPLLFVFASDESKQEIFFQFNSLSVRLLLFLKEIARD